MTRIRAWCSAPVMRLPLAALLSGAVVAAALARLQPASFAARAVSDLATVVAASLGTAWCAVAARRRGYARHSWLLFAAGTGLLTLAEYVWGTYELLLRRDVPSPGFADAGYLAGNALLAAGVLLLPPGRRRFGWPDRAMVARRTLDAFIVMGAALAISWALVLQSVYRQGHRSVAELVVVMAYPLTDVLMLACVGITVPSTPRAFRSSLAVLGSGLAAMALADGLYAYLTLRGDYASGGPLDGLYVAGYLLIAVGGLRAWQSAGRRADPAAEAGEDTPNGPLPPRARTIEPAGMARTARTARQQLLLPYVPLLLAVTVVMGQALTGTRPGQAETITAAVVTLLVFLRQFLMLNDNLRLLADLGKAQQELRHQAWHDGLTGLPNRLAFHRSVQSALDSRGSDGEVAVLMLDLDGFKHVNDTYGHQVGDQMLLGVALRVRAVLREGDIVARIGGDEFAVLLEHRLPDGKAAADLVAEAARRVVTAVGRGYSISGHRVRVGASVGATATGIARSAPISVTELLREADVALYAAKGRGRGQAVVFDPAMGAGERALTEQLRSILLDPHGEGIFPVFQPIVHLETGRLVGVEALARWQLPDGSMVAPDIFVPLVERAGLAAALFTRMLAAACRAWTSWPVPADGPDGPPFVLSVNVSAHQLDDGLLAGMVADLLEAYGIPPERLVLEVTESALAEDIERASATLELVARSGVRIAVDDFGTGWSSLSQLDRFPVHVLKVDRSFVSRLAGDGRAERLVAGVLRLSEGLGLHVVAEGIEDVDQLDRLRALGCRAGQGFLFCGPVPAQRIAQLLSGGARLDALGSSAA